ncbi:hypothetical protein T492DRAFT_903496 [Pavlovales sp. CCMP2436]|nr:hypothetical protein T492DRAFT_903496 [Pavlovales sp. CCMP2436]
MPPTKVARASTGDAAADDTATAVESGAERVSAAERSSGLQDLASAGMPPLGHAPFLVVALAFFSAIMTGTDSLTAQFVLALLVMTTTFGLIASFGAKSTPAGTARCVLAHTYQRALWPWPCHLPLLSRTRSPSSRGF